MPGKTLNLMLVARPGAARFHSVPKAPPNPIRPLAFQGLLRARLRGCLESVALRGGDRLLELRFPEHSLLLLFAGHTTDLLLVDREDRVLGSLRSTTKTGAIFEWSTSAGTGITDRFADRSDADLGDAVASFFDRWERTEDNRIFERRVAVYRVRLLKRIAKQRAEAERGQRAEGLRHQADLLRSAFHLIKRGASSIEVEDWTSGGRAVIQLEPGLSAADNLDRLYKKAAKATRSGELAALRLESSLRELKDLDGGQIPKELARSETRAGPGSGAQRRKKQGDRLPYRAWRSPSGVEIRVGRGARENDELTFRHSAGNDVWLHVRGRPGAHVVLRNPGTAPPAELLILAAQLALKHSGLKPGAREEVSWTRVKELRKPKGLGPGKVLLRTEKVLYLSFEPAALEVLESL
jgi:predicted ribosome quality control (RQC) complex YloA/Tae2 family protein